MNIKDFLIENYIWILMIILITIITIIGFLADKKKNGKKSEGQPIQNPNIGGGQPMNNMGQVQYNGQDQFMQNQMNNGMAAGINTNNFNSQIQPVNQVPNMPNVQSQTNMNSMNMNSMPPEQPGGTIPTSVDVMNNPSPVENVIPNTNSEPMYQPLSEQTPIISPRPVPNFPNMTNNNPEMVIPQMDNNNLNTNNQNVVPPMSQPNYNQPVVTQETLVPNQMANYNVPNQMSQPMNNSFTNVPNYPQSNTTTPEPVNSIQTPQPINPQPIVQGMYNNNQMMPQNYGQTMPQPSYNQPTVQEQPIQNQPINFVYGPQNNNQNM